MHNLGIFIPKLAAKVGNMVGNLRGWLNQQLNKQLVFHLIYCRNFLKGPAEFAGP
jgi:hypothetical protein